MQSAHPEPMLVPAALLGAALALAQPAPDARAQAQEASRRAEELWRRGGGARQDALDEAARAVRLCEAAFGTGHEATATALATLARVRSERADWHAARETAERALAIRRSLGRPAGLVAALQDVAEILEAMGRATEASARLDEAERVLPAPAGTTPAPGWARQLELRARLQRDAGDYVSALATASQALEAMAGADDPRRHAVILNLIGELEWFAARYDASLASHRRALEIAEAAFGPSHPLVGETLAEVALAEFDLGDVSAARELQERALAVTRDARGPGHPETLDRLHSLANFALDAGAYAQALDLYEQVLATTETRLGADSDEAAHLHYNLGILHTRMGEWDKARASFERARSLWESRRGGQHPFVARALEDLANVAAETGRLEEADGLLSRAVAIREKPGAAQPTNLAWALARLAWVRLDRGMASDAERLVERAVADSRTDGHPQADAARVLVLVGRVESRLGRFGASSTHLAAALAMYRRLFGDEHPQAAQAQALWARSLLRQGRFDDAFREALAAEATRRAHLRRTLRYLSPVQALSLVTRQPEGRDVLMSAVGQPGRAPDARGALALEALAAGRALALDEMAARRTAADASVPSELTGRLEAANARLARLLYREGDVPEARRGPALAEARAEVERLERQQAARLAPARDAARDALTFYQLANALPEGGVLVSYVRYRDVAAGVGSADTDDRYAAFVTRRGRETPAFVPLGSAVEIDARVEHWRAGIESGTPVTDSLASAERAVRGEGLQLRRSIWDPLLSEIGGASRLFVVPDGALALVQLDALPGSDGRYLAETAPVLRYLSSERDLVLTRPPRGHDAELLAYGNPAFGVRSTDTAARCGGRALRFGTLPGAADELAQVIEAWKSARPGAPFAARLASEASEAAFKADAPSATLIHLATHGFFVSAPCDGAGDESGDPLARAGLALAGANRREGQAQEDGLLTGVEIARLDLSRAATVVLSACGTGLGELRQGEGVVGLQRAFATAGAGVVVMSLWAVDDLATRRWMAAFYDAMLVGDSDPADAVRKAELRAMARLREESGAAPPSLWAAFVATGL